MSIEASRHDLPLQRLSSIQTDQDLRALSEAKFPGSHCPLFGVQMILRQIEGASMLIIGTEECGYYAKSLALNMGQFGPLAERCYCFCVDNASVSFGVAKSLKKALEELTETEAERPAVLFLVTTCVPELIGDDLDSLAELWQDEFGFPMLVVHTEHYKCQNHYPGMERALTALAPLICGTLTDGSCPSSRPQEEAEAQAGAAIRINLIGPRQMGFERSELAAFLKILEVEIAEIIPAKCSLEGLSQAADVSLNLVTDKIGQGLAQTLQRRLGLPYVYFDRFVSPKAIRAAYEDLLEKLKPYLSEARQQKAESWLLAREAEQKQVEAELRPKLAGLGFIYGNTPLLPLELSLYLTELGLEPRLIQFHELDENDEQWKAALLKLCDPYVCPSANIAPLQTYYPSLGPGFYLGHEFPDRLAKHGLVVQPMEMLAAFSGYQLNQQLLHLLSRAAEQVHLLQKAKIQRGELSLAEAEKPGMMQNTAAKRA